LPVFDVQNWELKTSNAARLFGGVRPVVQRELRVTARRPFNYWLRVGSAAAGMILLHAVVTAGNEPAAVVGLRLFIGLHTLFLWMICLIGPALTADCIAREKREGTLGLLFLTPLTARGIVLGKGLGQALRAFSIWLAVAPVLTIPFLTGGVGWYDTFSALTLEFCATVLCLAAGLLASSLAENRNLVFALALVLGFISVFLFNQFLMVCMAFHLYGFSLLPTEAPWEVFISEGPRLLTGTSSGWAAVSNAPRYGGIWPRLLVASPPAALLVFFAVVAFAARQVERSWRDKVPSLRREGLVRRYCAPLFRRRFARQMSRTLEWNPIAWLQEYSWKARLSKWGLCLAFAIAESLTVPRGGPSSIQVYFFVLFVLQLILALVMTFVGVSSFLAEKRTGALELILITPISASQIIFGRVWGLWKQFLPAALVLAAGFEIGCWSLWSYGWFNIDLMVETPIVIGWSFLVLPVFATYFALRVKNLIVGAALTWFALMASFMFGSLFFGALPFRVFDSPDSLPAMLIGTFIGNAAFALLTCFLLRHSLYRRNYSF
jgi:ABC-type Na+ efflux pump permease subunit